MKSTITIYNEDCRATQKREGLEYDYVCTSIADPQEIGFCTESFSINQTHWEQWKGFIRETLTCLTPKKGVITVFLSDKKSDGGIVLKHAILCEVFLAEGWKIRSQKIWDRQTGKGNQFRLGFTFIYTFVKGSFHEDLNAGESLIRRDVFNFPAPKYKDKRIGMNSYPVEIVSAYIEAYSVEGDTIFEPFNGIGAVPIACYGLNRNCVGAEIVPEIHEMFLERMKEVVDTKEKEEGFDALFK